MLGVSHLGQLEPGSLLYNRYKIVRRIGGGGMGSVYLAQDGNLADAPRAVKEMLVTSADQALHEKAIEDFRRESRLLASLEHPCIPTIYDFFFDGGRYYLVMKYIQGSDLATQLQIYGGKVDELTVVEWAVQICDLLHYLHGLNPRIIFRDLKPANVMLEEKGNRIMLIDFGIARTVTPAQKGVTAIGTMGYAPPELFAGNVMPQTDIYSLGATMFHLVTGSDPQDNPLIIFDYSRSPRPTHINPNLTLEMERILMRATDYQPEKRFSSALEMMGLLEKHRQQLRDRLISSERRSGPLAKAPKASTGFVICRNCGKETQQDKSFCIHCGQSQQPGPTTAKLVVYRTGEVATAYPIEKPNILIGRADPVSGIFPEVDLTKHDPRTKVSRRHAHLYRRGDQFIIEDVGSANGTVINGIRLTPNQPRELHNGDDLVLGETTIKFTLSE